MYILKKPLKKDSGNKNWYSFHGLELTMMVNWIAYYVN